MPIVKQPRWRNLERAPRGRPCSDFGTLAARDPSALRRACLRAFGGHPPKLRSRAAVQDLLAVVSEENLSLAISVERSEAGQCPRFFFYQRRSFLPFRI